MGRGSKSKSSTAEDAKDAEENQNQNLFTTEARRRFCYHKGREERIERKAICHEFMRMGTNWQGACATVPL
jgi:hypothetical protein